MLKTLLCIAAGSGLGGVARYLVGRWVQSLSGAALFPWGTFAVNVAGCLHHRTYIWSDRPWHQYPAGCEDISYSGILRRIHDIFDLHSRKLHAFRFVGVSRACALRRCELYRRTPSCICGPLDSPEHLTAINNKKTFRCHADRMKLFGSCVAAQCFYLSPDII